MKYIVKWQETRRYACSMDKDEIVCLIISIIFTILFYSLLGCIIYSFVDLMLNV